MMEFTYQPHPHRYADGRLTIEGMRAVLAEGGSVMYDGNLITDPRDLPPPPSIWSILVRVYGTCYSLGTVEYPR